MNKRTTERFRKKLERERRAIVLSIRRTRLEASEIEVGANADEADIAMVAHEMGLIFTLHDWALFRLKAITDALHRLETGEWGLCTECEEPIPKARLNAVPCTTLCVRCQDRDENIKRNKVQNNAHS